MILLGATKTSDCLKNKSRLLYIAPESTPPSGAFLAPTLPECYNIFREYKRGEGAPCT